MEERVHQPEMIIFAEKALAKASAKLNTKINFAVLELEEIVPPEPLASPQAIGPSP